MVAGLHVAYAMVTGLRGGCQEALIPSQQLLCPGSCRGGQHPAKEARSSKGRMEPHGRRLLGPPRTPSTSSCHPLYPATLAVGARRCAPLVQAHAALTTLPQTPGACAAHLPDPACASHLPVLACFACRECLPDPACATHLPVLACFACREHAVCSRPASCTCPS